MPSVEPAKGQYIRYFSRLQCSRYLSDQGLKVRSRVLRPLICAFLAALLYFSRVMCHGSLTDEVSYGEDFFESRLFSKLAVTENRIHATRRGVLQLDYYPPADNHCLDRTSGQVKFVSWDKRHLICYNNDYARIFQRLRSFQVNNFLVCDQDCSDSPASVFAVAKSRSIETSKERTLTLLPVNVGRHFKHVPQALADELSYDEKLPIAVWRGSTTSSCWELPLDENVSPQKTECSRRNLVTKWVGKEFKNIDVGLSNIVQLSTEVGRKYDSLVKGEMSVRRMLLYRYIISVEGNDVATNLKWALASNSVVMMPPPTRESIILESSLKPWVHYVPLLHDLSDLQRKIQFCDLNPTVCRNISSSATHFMLPFSTRDKLFSAGAHILQRFFQDMTSLGVFDSLHSLHKNM